MVSSQSIIIDCDLPAQVFEDCVLLSAHQIRNRTRGRIVIDPSRFAIYPSDGQQEYTNDREICESLENLKGYNACTAHILDYFLAQPDSIPELGDVYEIYFWGSIYQESIRCHGCGRPTGRQGKFVRGLARGRRPGEPFSPWEETRRELHLIWRRQPALVISL